MSDWSFLMRPHLGLDFLKSLGNDFHCTLTFLPKLEVGSGVDAE